VGDCERLLAELVVLIQGLIKEINERTGWMHEFAGCPESNFEFSPYGLRRGCILCRINRLLLKVEERK